MCACRQVPYEINIILKKADVTRHRLRLLF